MSVLKFRLKEHSHQPKGWSNQELSEFYRILDILDRAGIPVESDQGLSDEGEPWYVFCNRDKSEVVAHFARIDGEFYSISGITQEVYKGPDIRQVVDQMLANHPLMIPRVNGSSRLFMHPSAVLTAFVVASFFLTVDEGRTKELPNLFGQISELPEFLAEKNSDGVVLHGDRRDNDQQNQGRGGFLDSFAALGQSALLGAVMIIHEIMSEDPSGTSIFSSPSIWGPDYSSNEIISGTRDISSEISLKDPTGPAEDQSKNLITVSLDLDEGSTPLEKDTGAAKDKEQERGINLLPSSIDTVEKESGSSRDAIAFNMQDQTAGLGSKELSLPNSLSLRSWVPDINHDFFRTNDELDSVAKERIEYDDSLVALSVLNNDASNLGGVGVAIELEGRPSFLGLSSSLDDLGSASGLSFLEPMEFRNSFDEEAIIDDASALTSVNQQNFQEIMQTGDSNQNQVVRGHALWLHPSETVALSKDVDVVFYDGGDKEVKSFELGKDLLWFFLEPGVIEDAKVSVQNGTDLQLDFGDSGLLTFVDIVDSSQFDLFV